MSTESPETTAPGIDRLNYFLSLVAIGFTASAAVVLFGPGSSITKIVGLILTVAGFVLDVMRLRNIGVSQWFAMLRLLPFVNLLLSIGLLSAQPNWAESQRLDPSGRTIASFLAILYITIFILFNLAGATQAISYPFWS